MSRWAPRGWPLLHPAVANFVGDRLCEGVHLVPGFEFHARLDDLQRFGGGARDGELYRVASEQSGVSLSEGLPLVYGQFVHPESDGLMLTMVQ